jgi:hypothetical protein
VVWEGREKGGTKKELGKIKTWRKGGLGK